MHLSTLESASLVGVLFAISTQLFLLKREPIGFRCENSRLIRRRIQGSLLGDSPIVEKYILAQNVRPIYTNVCKNKIPPGRRLSVVTSPPRGTIPRARMRASWAFSAPELVDAQTRVFYQD